MCIESGVNVDTELNLIKHIIKKKHSTDLISSFDIANKRKAYFDKADSKYVGTNKSKVDPSNIDYFLKQKGITNLDLNDVISQLSTMDKDFNNRTVTSALYDPLNPNPVITSFDSTILRKHNLKPTCTPTTSFDSAILINSNDSNNSFSTSSSNCWYKKKDQHCDHKPLQL